MSEYNADCPDCNMRQNPTADELFYIDGDKSKKAWIRCSSNVDESELQDLVNVLEDSFIDDAILVTDDIEMLSHDEVESFVEELIDALEDD